jgi:hypothetical protein
MKVSEKKISLLIFFSEPNGDICNQMGPKPRLMGFDSTNSIKKPLN